MYVVTVLFEVGEGHVEAFRNTVAQQARNSLECEKDCLRFDVCVNPTDPRCFFLYEIYADKSAFDAHLQTEHFRLFDHQVKPWLFSKKVMIWELQEKGGKR